jgi:CMP/dCMP kinase
MIVAIDGPAGAGKSSVSRRLAERLGFRFLDTGAMYRAVTYAAIQQALDWHDEVGLLQLAVSVQIDLLVDKVLLNGLDVSEHIRTPNVSNNVHFIADHVAIRKHMVHLQRQFANNFDTVTEGRDQGTVAFPHAEVKIYLTATPEERAHRRHAELKNRGESLTFEEVLRMQNIRDLRDASREVGRLEKAVDAVEFFTDGLSTDDVVEQLETLIRKRLKTLPPLKLTGTN